MAKKADSSRGGDLGSEAELVKAADKIRANMEPSDYKQAWQDRQRQQHRADLQCGPGMVREMGVESH